MPPRSREERLFGAACLRLTLDASGKTIGGSEIYQATLRDLALSDEDVLLYLRDHRGTVEAALERRGPREN